MKLNQVIVFTVLFFYTPLLFAALPQASFQALVSNITESVPNLMQLVTAFAYVMGMFLVIKGLFKLKLVGETRSMYSSQDHGFKGPLIFLTVGVLLLYLPNSVEIAMSTFWNHPCPYCYVKETGGWDKFLSNCFIILQLIGAIAFIRGLITLGQLGEGSREGTFSKGITHIIGGVFCINIYQVVVMILFLLGYHY